MGVVGRRSRRKGARKARRARRAYRPRWVKALVLGMILTGVGFFAMLERLWPGMPGMNQLWPIFPILGGFALLLAVVVSGFRDTGPVFPGVAALGVGSFFFLFTLGPLDYDQMSELWPVFPLIGGVAFFWTWAASFGRRMNLLVPAALFCVVGVVGLMFTMSPLGSVLAVFGWPLLLLLVGVLITLLAVLSQAFRRAGVGP